MTLLLPLQASVLLAFSCSLGQECRHADILQDLPRSSLVPIWQTTCCVTLADSFPISGLQLPSLKPEELGAGTLQGC